MRIIRVESAVVLGLCGNRRIRRLLEPRSTWRINEPDTGAFALTTKLPVPICTYLPSPNTYPHPANPPNFPVPLPTAPPTAAR